MVAPGDATDDVVDRDVLSLHTGGATATVHPAAGGRLGQLTFGGRRYLRGHHARARDWAYWGSYPLVPWSNRIADGRFAFGGRTWELPERHVDGTALHGLVCRRTWDVVDATPTAARLRIRVTTPPWDLTCDQTFTLAADALEQVVAVRNDGDHDVPVGVGIHPWFPAGHVAVPADLVWPDVGCIPTGPPRPVRAEEDLRSPVVPRVMDTCFTGLTATAVRVGDLELSWRGPVEHVVVYTGEPGWMCVEPVTNANDGFNLLDRGIAGHGVVVLEPGAETGVTYVFRTGGPTTTSASPGVSP